MRRTRVQRKKRSVVHVHRIGAMSGSLARWLLPKSPTDWFDLGIMDDTKAAYTNYSLDIARGRVIALLLNAGFLVMKIKQQESYYTLKPEIAGHNRDRLLEAAISMYQVGAAIT